MKFLRHLVHLCLVPSLAFAGEPSNGTVIMISSVSFWLVASSGYLLWKEIRRNRKSKQKDPISQDRPETDR